MTTTSLRRFLLGLLASASLAALPIAAQTVTYSLADDFSYTTNLTNSTWSYRMDDWQSAPQTFLPLLTATNFDANKLWGTDFSNAPTMWSQGTNYWAIGKNATGQVQYSAITGNTWAPGDVLFWPKGGSTAPSRMVIGWTSPYKGVMDLNYTFDRASEIGNGIGYNLLYRSGAVDNELVGFTQIGVTFTDSRTGLTVNKGDQLFFRFDSWGPSDGDISLANIVITVTPATYSTKPEILFQPTGGIAFAGRDFFTFSVSATNVESYQWRKDRNPIADATQASYTINNLKTNDAGAYSVLLSNPLGSVTSADAILNVAPATVISTYSLAGDFSITNNGGSNPWSYGQDNVAGEPVQFLALTTNTRNANDLWGTDFACPPTMWSDAADYWGIGKNTSGIAQTSSSGITWNPGEVLLRPKATAPFPGRLVNAVRLGCRRRQEGRQIEG